MRLLLTALAIFLPFETLAAPWSSTQLFDSVVRLHFEEAKTCWRQKRIPSQRTIGREISGMSTACARFWPGDSDAPYRMLAVMITESGGNNRNTAKPTEPSYGPWCGTVEEARETSRLFPDIGCPRGNDSIIDKFQSDPEWAAMIAAGTIWRYDRAQCGDLIRGLLMYKFGGEGLRRACAAQKDRPVTELAVWRHFNSCYAWTMCLRDRVVANSTPPCGCATP